MRRIAGIVANAEAALLVSPTRGPSARHLLRAQCPSLRGVAHRRRSVAPRNRRHYRPAARGGRRFSAIHLGQHRQSQGVVLTHANLLANLDAMAHAAGVSGEDVFVSWLPLYHDMG